METIIIVQIIVLAAAAIVLMESHISLRRSEKRLNKTKEELERIYKSFDEKINNNKIKV